jgi:hypothetical protein
LGIQFSQALSFFLHPLRLIFSEYLREMAATEVKMEVDEDAKKHFEVWDNLNTNFIAIFR